MNQQYYETIMLVVNNLKAGAWSSHGRVPVFINMKRKIPHWRNRTLRDLTEYVDGIGLVTEEWKDIEDYEGMYRVSTFGRVKSLGFKRNGYKPKILKHGICRQGYHRVALYRNGDGVQLIKGVHVLVAQAFIPNPDKLPEVNHKWSVKSDNRISELEWNTQSDNNKHAFKIGARTHKGENHPQAKLTSKSAMKIFKSKLSYREIAELNGVSINTVVSIKRGSGWSHITGKYYIPKTQRCQVK